MKKRNIKYDDVIISVVAHSIPSVVLVIKWSNNEYYILNTYTSR